ncbi:hypothetical protein COU75_00410 [Candidatus Peregrinibacteria bacterium CG10_big_fil_rev_8_21_14_0_10_42_8]|nr:MAG: hypothetical protein COU75_00410 [Candidatus Peregrinibacteria bacterium CG10_big_fil_rev_8_21_14_0_10_42_8]
MNNFRTLYISAFLVLLGSSTATIAATFPDVPDGHLFQESVEALVQAQVINGNPDGTFAPDDYVNRAAMLKMLYKAQGKTPDPLSVRCFPDVEIGSWYESFVCDAAAMRYVNGYTDGTFRPDTPVNRVEALKMITQVFNIPVEDVTESDRDLVKFVDVSVSAWYTQYLITAYLKGILPIPGESGSEFHPDMMLTRGEAAAYIYNALGVELSESRKQKESTSSSSIESSSEYSSAEISSTSNTESSLSSVVSTDTSIVQASFPFEYEARFKAKESKSYYFDIDSPKTVSFTTTLQSGQPGEVVCRLYLVDESGFSDEYYLGFQSGKSCFITAALNPGEYQLQLFPTVKDTTFMTKAEIISGDGNDGFRESIALSVNKPVEGVLTAVDLEDWYKFTVVSQQKMTFTMSNPTELRCIIYVMNDVDLASFSGPQCNQNYDFPAGTYYIAVGRKAPKGAQQSYTVRLEK